MDTRGQGMFSDSSDIYFTVGCCIEICTCRCKRVRIGSIIGIFALLQVTTVPDEGENSFKMPRASVVHMTSTATRPQHMSQVSIFFNLLSIIKYQVFLRRRLIADSQCCGCKFD